MLEQALSIRVVPYTASTPSSIEEGVGVAFNSEAAINASQVGNGAVASPPSQALYIDGITLFRIALGVYDALARPESPQAEPGRRGLAYADVEVLLEVELRNAYEFLSQPAVANLWHEHCGPELARAVRELRRSIPESRRQNLLAAGYTHPDAITEDIKVRRLAFFHAIAAQFPEAKDSTTANLAWHIIVESALLNEQLVQDMHKLATEKNAWSVDSGWQAFFGPDPPPEARAAFNQYVLCRWPIHVFALDPVEQDQNIASGFSRRRELQLVLALAAANRFITLNSLTQFVRRLEYDLETIDLNKTAVGFTHGSDTFGWRFVPRVQAPPVASNLEAGVARLAHRRWGS